jgi:4-amino-4-deoxy-L-arabinose transferase-like glycosyltransferase
MALLSPNKKQKLLNLLPVIIIILGIVLRIVVYFQDRCLIIDEANIARNLFERDFAGLTRPLSYEQYAPPVFLWIQKIATGLFGFSEMALRIYPLLSGIAMLILLYRVLKHYSNNTAIWYALVLAATGAIYLRYSTEVKQYMPDAAIVLALILFALNNDILKMSKGRFILTWLIVGSVTVWASMPGIFMLTGIGFYYFYIIAKAKAWNRFLPLVTVGVLWAAQFAFYYFSILQAQATSGYLQNWHQEYFLYIDQWEHNWELAVMKMLGGAGGHWALSIGFHLVCIVVGIVQLARRHDGKLILVITPLLLLLATAMMHRYSLIPRLTLFCMPLLLVLIAAGLSTLFRVSPKVLGAVYIVLALICINNFNEVDVVTKPMVYEEMRSNLDYLKNGEVDSSILYVHNLAQPAYLYYTQIHPRQKEWAVLKNARLLTWDDDFDAIGRDMPAKSAILYGWVDPAEMNVQLSKLSQHATLVSEQRVMGGAAFIFRK